MAFGLFKKKKKKESSPSDTLTTTINQVIKETADAVSVVFDLPELDYKAGQFITIVQEVNGKKIRRAYSLCSAKSVDQLPAVAVKRVEGGQMSNFINDHFQAGQKVEIMPPMGNFTLDKAQDANQIVLFGGGSGITPLLSIAKTALYTSDKRVFLLYANRNEDSIIFKNSLKQLEAEYKGRFTVVHSLDNPLGEWSGLSGFLTKEAIENTLKSNDINIHEAISYTCGPEPLMNLVIDSLDQLGVASEMRFKESFVASTDTSVASSDSSSGEHEVKVIMDGEEHVYAVSGKKSILETGLDLGIDLPYSCQSGLCTACRGKVQSGKVHMTEADGLTQEEIDEGYVLCCVGHPKSDDVVIEIG